MNDYSVIFSRSHPSNESGEYIWSPLFCSSSINPDLLLEDLDFPKSEWPAKCIDDPDCSKGADKKWLHKLTERERRKDMRSRYSALRSFLPQENVRRKAPITDQLSEAADYIRCLQVKVEELASKRDEMKKMNLEINSSKKRKVYNALPCNKSVAFPLVNLNLLGSGLVITVNTLRGQIELWKLLLAVEEEGLQVLTTTSFATGDKVFCIVHCKVSDVTNFKSGTQFLQKLAKFIA